MLPEPALVAEHRRFVFADLLLLQFQVVGGRARFRIV